MGDKMGKTYGAGKKAEDLGIREVVLDEICQLAEQYGVENVLLFGSRARGDFWRARDIDLGEPVAKEFAETIKKEGIVLYEKV